LNKVVVTILMVIIFALSFNSLSSKVSSQLDRMMMMNFTELFEDELTGEEACGLDYCSLYLDVEYQSSSTVVLEGKLLRLAEGIIGYTENDLIWKGVDLLKEEGYVIDSVLISGLGTDTNPYTYHVIMSRVANSTYAAE
jgi:hypothetical protein